MKVGQFNLFFFIFVAVQQQQQQKSKIMKWSKRYTRTYLSKVINLLK